MLALSLSILFSAAWQKAPAQFYEAEFFPVQISIEEEGMVLPFSATYQSQDSIRIFSQVIDAQLVENESRPPEKIVWWSPPVVSGAKLIFADTAFYIAELEWAHFEVIHEGKKMELRLNLLNRNVSLSFQEGSFELPSTWHYFDAMKPGTGGSIWGQSLENYRYRAGESRDCFFKNPFRIDWQTDFQWEGHAIPGKDAFALIPCKDIVGQSGYYFSDADGTAPEWLPFAQGGEKFWEWLPFSGDRFFIVCRNRVEPSWSLNAKGYVFNPQSKEPRKQVLTVEDVSTSSSLFPCGKKSAIFAAFRSDNFGRLYFSQDEGENWVKFGTDIRHQTLHPDPESGRMILLHKTAAGNWAPHYWSPKDTVLRPVPFPDSLLNDFVHLTGSPPAFQFWVSGEHCFYLSDSGALYHARYAEMNWKLILNHVELRELSCNPQGRILIQVVDSYMYSPDAGLNWELFPSLPPGGCKPHRLVYGGTCYDAETIFVTGQQFRILWYGISALFDPATMRTPYLK